LPVNEAGTDMIGAAERVAHVAECLPEICTLDCGTMNFAEADYVMTNTPGMLRAMGRMMTDLGVKPEIEAFDTGHLWFAKELVKEGVLEAPALVQLCMGVPWGAPDDLNTFMAMVNNVPEDWTFSAFSLGRNQMAYAAAAVLAGGHVRVGLEDNLWLDKGVLATNAQLVARAVGVVEGMGARVIGPQEVREKLGLTKRAPARREPAHRHHRRSLGHRARDRGTVPRRGADVAICDVDPEAVADFARAHPGTIAEVADVTSEDRDGELPVARSRRLGQIDVVCANAGTGGPAGLIEHAGLRRGRIAWR
jgi:hypothetical protein